MMFTNNDVFIDSSILVEYVKNTKTKLLSELLTDVHLVTFINETVVSEFMLYFIAINGNASPRSLKNSDKIFGILTNNIGYNFLYRFNYLSTNDAVYTLVPRFMKEYNLLPNDAIILATCKIHGITKLASHDSDFIIPCEREGIELLTEN